LITEVIFYFDQRGLLSKSLLLSKMTRGKIVSGRIAESGAADYWKLIQAEYKIERNHGKTAENQDQTS